MNLKRLLYQIGAIVVWTPIVIMAISLPFELLGIGSLELIIGLLIGVPIATIIVFKTGLSLTAPIQWVKTAAT